MNKLFDLEGIVRKAGRVLLAGSLYTTLAFTTIKCSADKITTSRFPDQGMTLYDGNHKSKDANNDSNDGVSYDADSPDSSYDMSPDMKIDYGAELLPDATVPDQGRDIMYERDAGLPDLQTLDVGISDERIDSSDLGRDMLADASREEICNNADDNGNSEVDEGLLDCQKLLLASSGLDEFGNSKQHIESLVVNPDLSVDYRIITHEFNSSILWSLHGKPQPALSGQYVAFVHDDQIYMKKIDGSGDLIPVAPFDTSGEKISTSPDGKKLAFVDGSPQQFLLADLETLLADYYDGGSFDPSSHIIQLTDHTIPTQENCGRVDLGSAYLVGACYNGEVEQSEIVRVDLSTLQEIVLVTQAEYPILRPNQSQIVYNSMGDGPIYVAGIDGSNQSYRASRVPGTAFSWAPESFAPGDAVHIFPEDGGQTVGRTSESLITTPLTPYDERNSLKDHPVMTEIAPFTSATAYVDRSTFSSPQQLRITGGGASSPITGLDPVDATRENYDPTWVINN